MNFLTGTDPLTRLDKTKSKGISEIRRGIQPSGFVGTNIRPLLVKMQVLSQIFLK